MSINVRRTLVLGAVAAVAVKLVPFGNPPTGGGAPSEPVRLPQVLDDGTSALPPRANPRALLAAEGSMGDVSYGREDAPVTVVEYAALSCVHCHRFHTMVFPILKARYVDTGLVRWVVREYLSDSVATGGAMLARCVGRTPEGTRDAFEAIMREQPFFLDPRISEAEVPSALFRAVGRSFGIDRAAFSACISDPAIYRSVNATYKAGRDLFGVTETPTFFVDGIPMIGDRPPEEFDALIRSRLPKDTVRSREETPARPGQSALNSWDDATIRR